MNFRDELITEAEVNVGDIVTDSGYGDRYPNGAVVVEVEDGKAVLVMLDKNGFRTTLKGVATQLTSNIKKYDIKPDIDSKGAKKLYGIYKEFALDKPMKFAEFKSILGIY